MPNRLDWISSVVPNVGNTPRSLQASRNTTTYPCLYGLSSKVLLERLEEDKKAALSEAADLKKKLAKQEHVVRTLKAQSRPQKKKKKEKP